MQEGIQEQSFKRRVAYKMQVGSVLAGKPIMENERFRFLEFNGKEIIRVNLVANIIDKFVQEGEKKYASLTLDDASGQIKVKAFGEDVKKFEAFTTGDTVLVVGLLRSWNNEVYITSEIMKKKEPAYLLVRKLEIEADMPKTLDSAAVFALKDKIIVEVKNAESTGGVEIEKLIMELKESPEVINQEIKRLLEEGMVYEPRPGRLRWLG